MTTKPHRIVIIDDHPVIHQALAGMIRHEKDLEIAGQASTIEDGLKMVATLKPDLVITDVSLETGCGIDIVKSVKQDFPEIHMLVFSMHDETIYAERALRAGAMGYVMKHESMSLLLAAIRKVLTGQIHLSEAMATQLLDTMSSTSPNQKISSRLEGLSDRELEVFRFIGQGQSVKEIADHLRLSTKTVESHRSHIKGKLGIKGSRELLYFAVQTAME